MATSIFVADQHLRLFKSGYPSPTFRGERISDQEIDYVGLHAVFPMITEDEAADGNRDFFCLYLKNVGLLPAKGIVLFSSNTRASSTHVRWGIDPAGVGDGISSGKAQEIINKNTTPLGVAFRDGTSRTGQNVTVLPTIPKGKSIAIWFERSNVFNARPEPDDNFTLVIDTTNIIGDTGIVDQPGTNTDVIGGGSDVNIDLDWINKFIALKFLSNFFFLGNTTTADDPTAWINNVAKFPIFSNDPTKNFLKDIMKFIFGRLDVTNTPKRNQIINAVDPKAKSGYQLVIKKNIAYIILDTSGYQVITNPSAHYNKIVSYLNIANQHPNVDFKVVLSSTSPYGQLPDNDQDAQGNNNIRLDSTTRNTYHQLFIDKRVHLWIGAGMHNYQRSHILGYNAATSDDPSTFFTGDAPHYTFAEDVKDFGNTGLMFINAGTLGKTPIHNVPTENAKLYIAKTVIPTDGPCFLELSTRQRDADYSPTMEGRLYQYTKRLPATSQNLARFGTLLDQFSIKYHQPPVTSSVPGED